MSEAAPQTKYRFSAAASNLDFKDYTLSNKLYDSQQQRNVNVIFLRKLRNRNAQQLKNLSLNGF